MLSEIIQFEERKRDHIRIALDKKSQSTRGTQLDQVELTHEALPELNFDQVNTECTFFGKRIPTPLFVSSMTAGHTGGESLNQIIAEACNERGWIMGVGSQRRELNDPEARKEWSLVRKSAPDVTLLGNIGLAQAIECSTAAIEALVESAQAAAIFIHLNPLQECMQPEGTPRFAGGLDAIKRLSTELSVPVIVKETGSGISARTLKVLNETNLAAVDVSGLGGTHWGRVEGQRVDSQDLHHLAAETFGNWGIPTVDALLAAVQLQPKYKIWASGGVRSGLDAAKLIALGAEMVGFAQPIMKAAVEGKGALLKKMFQLEFELKVALFCTGSRNLEELREIEKCVYLRG